MNKVRGLLQAVGFLTLALLAVYGALAFAGGAGPLPGALSARAQEALPNAEVTAPEFVTGTVVSASPDGGALAPTVNYQGIIRLADGSFPPPGTTYDITARVYTNTVAPVAKAIYTTKKTGVSIRDGVFNIVLGDEPALPADAFSTAPRYVGIELGAGDGTHELIPRQRVHSVPWAMYATNSGQAVYALGAGNTPWAVNAGTANTLANPATVGSVTVNGVLTANGALAAKGGLDVQRHYKMYRIDVGENIYRADTDLGQWDICVLSGHLIDAPQHKATCWISTQPDQKEFAATDTWHVPAADRTHWYFHAERAYGVWWLACTALCMDIGVGSVP